MSKTKDKTPMSEEKRAELSARAKEMWARRKAAQDVPLAEKIEAAIATPQPTQRRIQVELPINPMVAGDGDQKYKDTKEWHYFLCIEPPKDMNLPSEFEKFKRAGYEPIEQIQEGMTWMRLPQAQNQRNLKQQEQVTAARWERPELREPEKMEDATLAFVSHSRTPQLVNAGPA